jgi:hypothetical protein
MAERYLCRGAAIETKVNLEGPSTRACGLMQIIAF